ncbi:unnamed protein product [Calicophoron daubneyi]|uniref:DUF4806 domain-containing protein n=1 Tax=Calicophoron daubneyi TaxID=300641 RepID=A0AAV2TNA0_CALDB
MVARIENLDMHVRALDVQVNNYHNDVLKKSCTESPTKPRWRPWFPLKTITELSAMEDNLQNENCRADVVNLIKRTPTSNMTERTKCCLARLISEDLSKELSWQKTPNRQPFGPTSLWAVVLG